MPTMLMTDKKYQKMIDVIFGRSPAKTRKTSDEDIEQKSYLDRKVIAAETKRIR